MTKNTKQVWAIGDIRATHAIALVSVATLSDLAESKRRYCNSYGLRETQVWVEKRN